MKEYAFARSRISVADTSRYRGLRPITVAETSCNNIHGYCNISVALPRYLKSVTVVDLAIRGRR